MKADHQTQTQRLQLQVEQVQGELLRYRTQEERRQKDIDTLLLSAKKKTEVLEVMARFYRKFLKKSCTLTQKLLLYALNIALHFQIRPIVCSRDTGKAKYNIHIKIC